MFRFLLLPLTVLCVSETFAAAALRSGDWSYVVNVEPGTGASVATITSYEGSGGTAVIPSEVNGIPVRTVGAGLYALDKFNANKLTGIIIPDSVTNIADYAFWQCYTLANVTLANSVKTIGYGAFAYCNVLTSITIPDSVTSLGNYAFYRARVMTSATIGRGITSLGQAVFSDSPLLAGIAIPDTVTSIGDYAFNNNNGMASVTIPSSVTAIGKYAFGNCDSLTSVVIPDSVTSLGEGVFAESLGLASVTLGRGLTTIGYRAFSLCDGLTSVSIPDGVTDLPGRLFYDCLNLVSVTIGRGVSGVGDQAFDLCPQLTSVVFLGNAPMPSGTTQNLFGSSNPQVYRIPLATGWGPVFAGRTTFLLALSPGLSGFSEDHQFTFTWTGTGEVPMMVQRRSSLGAGSWGTIATGITGGAFTDSNPPPGGAFYRAALP